MRSSRPSRLNARISSFTQRERAARGEQITIWQADFDNASVSKAAQVRRAREFFAVAENRRQALRYRATVRDLADQLLRRPICLEGLVQPRCPAGIAVAIADERFVLRSIHSTNPTRV